MKKQSRRLSVALLTTLAVLCGSASLLAFAGSIEGEVSRTIALQNDAAFAVATAATEVTTETYFEADAQKTVYRRVCDNQAAVVLKLDYTGKDHAKAGIGVILTAARDTVVKVNPLSADPAAAGWTTVVTNESGALTGSALLGSKASGLSDHSILYYYLGLGDYFASGDVLYVQFGDVDAAAGNGNGTCLFDRIDVYDNLTVSDGSIVVGAGETVTASLSDLGKIYKVSAGAGYADKGAGGKYPFRWADQTDYWMYKVTFPSDSADAAMGVVAKSSSNMCIRVSTDENAPLADWTVICDVTKDRYGAAATESVDVTESDGAFSMWYFSLGRYLENGKPLFLRFGAKDTTQGNSIQVADRVVFYAEKRFAENVIDLDVNHLAVDVTDESQIFVNVLTGLTTNTMGTGRFADVDHYFKYKIVLLADQCENIYMKAAMLGVNRAISFSKDNESYRQVASAPDASGLWGADKVLGDTYYYKLDDYVGKETVSGVERAVVYVKFHASDETQGNGACVYGLEFLNGSVKPAAKGGTTDLTAGTLAYEIDVLDDALIHSAQSSSAGTYFGQWGRKAAGSGANFAYRFTLPEGVTAFSVSVNRINSLLFAASADGNSYENFSPLSMSSDGNGSAVCYDLSALLDKGRTVYLRFSGTNGQESMLLGMFLLLKLDENKLTGNPFSEESYQSFTTGDASEKTYWQNESSLNIKFVGNYREFNNTAAGIYKFQYAADAEQVHLFGQIGGTYVLSVSTDGEHWTDLSTAGVQYYDSTVYPWYEVMADFRWNISDLVMTDNAERSVYVRVADAVTDNASGATLRGLGIVNCRGEERKPAAASGCGSSVHAEGWLLALLLGAAAVGIAGLKKGSKRENR